MPKEPSLPNESFLRETMGPTDRRTFLKMAFGALGAITAGALLPASRLLASPEGGSAMADIDSQGSAGSGPFKLPALPYAKDALVPYLSKETFDYHYGKHHQAYVDNLNKLVPGSKFENLDLETLIRQSSDGIFNNAAQHWNHSFYWNSLSDQKNQSPSGSLAKQVDQDFGSLAGFEEQFAKAAVGLFGSGWAWLSWSPDEKKLKIEATSNAGLPLTGPNKPLFNCDVWEHAYYIDYRNARAKYLEAFWKVLNWDFAGKNFGQV